MGKERGERKSDKSFWQKAWHFLWYEDSVASWVVSILLAFILIKFVIYPGLGLVFGTQFPVVAVVSGSMEHNAGFDEWWEQKEPQYKDFGITKEGFEDYPLHNGFNKGDIILLVGAKPEKLQPGQIIVYWSADPRLRYPIIHRLLGTTPDNRLVMMGDNPVTNRAPDPLVDQDRVVGRAILRVPYLGWVKIGFVNLLNAAGIPVA